MHAEQKSQSWVLACPRPKKSGMSNCRAAPPRIHACLLRARAVRRAVARASDRGWLGGERNSFSYCCRCSLGASRCLQRGCLTSSSCTSRNVSMMLGSSEAEARERSQRRPPKGLLGLAWVGAPPLLTTRTWDRGQENPQLQGQQQQIPLTGCVGEGANKRVFQTAAGPVCSTCLTPHRTQQAWT